MSQKLKICDKGVSQKTGTTKNFTEMSNLSKTLLVFWDLF